MIRIEIIEHKNITYQLLDKVIELKSSAWDYPYESQINWIKQNINSGDYHVFLKDNNEFEAYLNIIDISFVVNNITYHGYGIGNVCSKTQGMGFGKSLITNINNYLLKSNKIGVLFCKDSLTNFYSILEWKIIDPKIVSLQNFSKQINTMIYNFDQSINSFSYLGKLF